MQRYIMTIQEWNKNKNKVIDASSNLHDYHSIFFNINDIKKLFKSY